MKVVQEVGGKVGTTAFDTLVDTGELATFVGVGCRLEGSFITWQFQLSKHFSNDLNRACNHLAKLRPDGINPGPVGLP